MLKKRVIPVLLLQNGRMVKGKQFKHFKDTGAPNTAVRIYSAQDADELVFIDIQSNSESRKALVEIVHAAAKECFMPLTVGGGIQSIQDVREVLFAGADKVIITTAAAGNPQLLTEIARHFGAQSVVAGIDYRQIEGKPKVFTHCGQNPTSFELIAYAKRLAESGAGEIFLNSIDRDGMMGGYDIALAREVAHAVSVPVIVCGGAGNFSHIGEALNGETGIAAAACSSLFHFGDNNPIRARSYLRNVGALMRVLK